MKIQQVNVEIFLIITLFHLKVKTLSSHNLNHMDPLVSRSFSVGDVVVDVDFVNPAFDDETGLKE